jgi:hypothetical protein
MENAITTTIPGLQAAAAKAKAGLSNYKTEIGLMHSNAEIVAQELDDLIVACGNYDEGKLELARRRAVQRSLATAARAHAKLTRDVLKPHLGDKHSDTWKGVGYLKSLKAPFRPGPLQAMMAAMKSYLTAHGEHEVPNVDVTATRSGSLHDQLLAANGAVGVQRTVVNDLSNTRRKKAAALRRRLRQVLAELKMKLDPLDARWLAFGFNKPGQKKTPAVPENVTVTALTPTSCAVKWPASPRAEYYRVWKKAVGVDEAPLPVGNSGDLDLILETLPSNATIELSVSAVNNGGESARSEPIMITIR